MKPFALTPFRSLPDTPRVPHPYLSLPVRDVVVDSVPFGRHRVRVRVHGEGPPLLLLHGLMTTGYSFRYVVAPLGRKFTVYVPDFVGAGESEKPDRPYRAAALATWIGELQRALGIRGCDVVANSMAGYLAMRLALDDPGSTKRLLVVHAPGVPLPRLAVLRTAMRLPLAETVLRGLVRFDVDRWVHRNVHYYDDSFKSREECRVYGAPLREPEGLHAFARILREAMDPDDIAEFDRRLEALRDAGQGFPVPLRFLYAEKDPMVPAKVGEALRALVPHAGFSWVPNASHFMHVDAVDRFLPLAFDFLA